MIAVLALVALAGVWIAAAVAARHRAQSAADLAALAGAARVPGGSSVACAQAQAVAGEMAVSIRRCELDDLDLVVTVAVPVGGRFGGEAVAAARAGPAG